MDKYLTDKKYWEKRARVYDKLQWTKREEYLKEFLKMCELNKNDEVLDLGTGTGTIAFSLYDKVKKVVGVDYAEDMLEEARKHNNKPTLQFICADVRKMPLLDNSFTRATARMVFHYLVKGLDEAVREVRRVLKPGGLFVLSEGVPPDRCVEKFYKDIFKLKEKRVTFFPEDLKEILVQGKFKNIKMSEFVMKHCSIKNWLDNAGNLSEEAKKKIYRMHLNLHEKGKKAYNMKITSADCFIDMKFIIASGRK